MLGKLRWNSIYNLNLGVDGVCQKAKHWVYFPHKEAVFFRTGFFHNFSNSTVPRGKSALYTEVSYSDRMPVDKNKIIAKIVTDLKSSGVLCEKNKIVILDINDIKYGYPIYDKYYSYITKAIKKFLLHNDIITCGRYGNWKYMSMEDVILDGKETADKIKT